MKALKYLVLTSALAAALTGSAFATNTLVVVHLVGAPAFRQPVNDAIETVVESFPQTGPNAAGLISSGNAIPAAGHRLVGSTTETAKANQWLIPGFSSGIDLEINASYTGSTAGVESVAGQSKTQKFITNGTGTVSSPLGSQSVATVYSPDSNWITASDTFQGSTLFANGLTTFYGAVSHGSPFTATYNTLTADLGNSPGGVEVYHWVVSPGAPSRFSNITTAQANLLYSLGSLPLSFFTGNNSDEGTTVYALSRDAGSGARTVALAEIGVQPAGTNNPILSYVPTISSTGTLDSQGDVIGGTITAINEAPVGTIPSTGIYEPAGDTGYASFGTAVNGGSTADNSTSSLNYGLLQAITATPPSGALFVTYLDNDDSNEALQNGISGAGSATTGAKVLSYNGVTAGTTDGASDPAVSEGEYTFWSYESFLAPTSQGSTSAAFETDVEAQFPAFATLAQTTLNVSRSADGGPLAPGGL